MAVVKIIPVIMSGGSGTRLWPLSTAARPKQFHYLGAERTMIEETVLRFSGEHRGRPLSAAGDHRVGGPRRSRFGSHAKYRRRPVRRHS